MFEKIKNTILDFFIGSEDISKEMMDSIENENDFRNMQRDCLKIKDVEPHDEITLRDFNIDPNKKTIVMIDDYAGITNTADIIINTSKDLNIDDYNIIKFWGIKAGKELLFWLEKNPEITIDIAIIDMLINGIDGVDIIYKMLKYSPNVRYKFYTGVDLEGNEYKYNKARAKYLEFIGDDFLDKVVLKSKSFKDVIAPSLYTLIKG
jgi:hypothetical protein